LTGRQGGGSCSAGETHHRVPVQLTAADLPTEPAPNPGQLHRYHGGNCQPVKSGPRFVQGRTIVAMTKCKECQPEISTKAEACPKCGAKD
jgi:hypothetical protein